MHLEHSQAESFSQLFHLALPCLKDRDARFPSPRNCELRILLLLVLISGAVGFAEIRESSGCRLYRMYNCRLTGFFKLDFSLASKALCFQGHLI